MAKPKLFEFTIVVYHPDAPHGPSLTLNVNGFTRRDAQRQARAFIKHLTYKIVDFKERTS